MTSKTRNYLRWAPSAMVAVFIVSSSIMKIANAPDLAEQYARMGMQHQMAFFAIAELLFVSLFMYPRTMRLGILLFTGYYGGAMGVELSLGGYFIVPAIILTAVWIGGYLRDSSLFNPVIKPRKNFA